MKKVNRKLFFKHGDDPFMIVDGAEQTILVSFPHELPEIENCLSFKCWGASLELNDVKELNIKGDGLGEEVYISGFSNFDFYGVKKIAIEVTPYLNDMGTDFCKTEDGTSLKLCSSISKSSDLSDCILHEIEAAIAWPYGYCNFKIWSIGKVEFEFDDNDLVAISEYTKNPKKYSYFPG